MSTRIITLALLITALIAVGSTPADADTQAWCTDGSAHTFLRLTTSITPWDGCSVVVPTSLATVEVWAGPTAPVSRVRFSIQDPPFGTIVFGTLTF